MAHQPLESQPTYLVDRDPVDGNGKERLLVGWDLGDDTLGVVVCGIELNQQPSLSVCVTDV